MNIGTLLQKAVAYYRRDPRTGRRIYVPATAGRPGASKPEAPAEGKRQRAALPLKHSEFQAAGWKHKSQWVAQGEKSRLVQKWSDGKGKEAHLTFDEAGKHIATMHVRKRPKSAHLVAEWHDPAHGSRVHHTLLRHLVSEHGTVTAHGKRAKLKAALTSMGKDYEHEDREGVTHTRHYHPSLFKSLADELRGLAKAMGCAGVAGVTQETLDGAVDTVPAEGKGKRRKRRLRKPWSSQNKVRRPKQSTLAKAMSELYKGFRRGHWRTLKASGRRVWVKAHSTAQQDAQHNEARRGPIDTGQLSMFDEGHGEEPQAPAPEKQKADFDTMVKDAAAWRHFSYLAAPHEKAPYAEHKAHMAETTRFKLDDWLKQRFGLDDSQARDVSNTAEMRHNGTKVGRDGVTWDESSSGGMAEPKWEDYPDLAEKWQAQAEGKEAARGGKADDGAGTEPEEGTDEGQLFNVPATKEEPGKPLTRAERAKLNAKILRQEREAQGRVHDEEQDKRDAERGSVAAKARLEAPFKEGQRVVMSDGRHGTVIEVEPVVMGSFHGPSQVRHIQYRVRSDNGKTHYVFGDKELAPETEKPEKVVPDIQHRGEWHEPVDLYHRMGSLRSEIVSAKARHDRARTKKDEHRQTISEKAKELAEIKQAFRPWAEAHPDELEAIRNPQEGPAPSHEDATAEARRRASSYKDALRPYAQEYAEWLAGGRKGDPPADQHHLNRWPIGDESTTQHIRQALEAAYKPARVYKPDHVDLDETLDEILGGKKRSAGGSAPAGGGSAVSSTGAGGAGGWRREAGSSRRRR